MPTAAKDSRLDLKWPPGSQAACWQLRGLYPPTESPAQQGPQNSTLHQSTWKQSQDWAEQAFPKGGKPSSFVLFPHHSDRISLASVTTPYSNSLSRRDRSGVCVRCWPSLRDRLGLASQQTIWVCSAMTDLDLALQRGCSFLLTNSLLSFRLKKI